MLFSTRAGFEEAFPTRVGVNPTDDNDPGQFPRFPHAGGGEPDAGQKEIRTAASFPHAGGGEPPVQDLARPRARNRFPHAGGGEPDQPMAAESVRPGAFPTRVGVNPVSRRAPDSFLGFPHAGGGEPYSGAKVSRAISLSPRGWG